MKTLFLLRHAKSSWNDPHLADFDRPLNDRGLGAAPFMGSFMKKNGFIPDVVISSPARRAKQTSELAAAAAGIADRIRYDERVYEASPQTIRQVLSEIDDSVNSVMVVGHNPGMEGVIRLLSYSNESMPTAGLAIISLDIEKWQEIGPDCGILQRLVRPKEEMNAFDASA